MTNSNSIDKLSILGLKPEELEGESFQDDDQLIELISQSGLLYRRSIRHIVLKRIRDFFSDNSIKPHEELKNYFPRKQRKRLWNKFRDYLDLQAPGLKLTRFAQFLCFLTVLGFFSLLWGLFTGGIELLLAWKLTGLSLFPLIALFFIPIGIIMTHGTNRLPARTVDDLIDEIISINNIDLLTNDKKELKSLLRKDLDRVAAHNII